MLFDKLNRTIPTYKITNEEIKQIKTEESFSSSISNKSTKTGSFEQNQGTAAELVFAKYLKENYQDEWIWVDDMNTNVIDHDFLIRYNSTWIGVDVKSRLAYENNEYNVKGIPSRFKPNPGFFTRYHARKNVKRVHLKNHVHVLIVLGNYKDKFEYGSIVGCIGINHILKSKEYQYLIENGKYKTEIKSSESEPIHNLESVIINSLESVKQCDGFPSIVNKIINGKTKIKDSVVDELLNNDTYITSNKKPLTDDYGIDINKYNIDKTNCLNVIENTTSNNLKTNSNYKESVSDIKRQEFSKQYRNKIGDINPNKLDYYLFLIDVFGVDKSIEICSYINDINRSLNYYTIIKYLFDKDKKCIVS